MVVFCSLTLLSSCEFPNCCTKICCGISTVIFSALSGLNIFGPVKPKPAVLPCNKLTNSVSPDCWISAMKYLDNRIFFLDYLI